jgi:hypothetical protein
MWEILSSIMLVSGIWVFIYLINTDPGKSVANEIS